MRSTARSVCRFLEDSLRKITRFPICPHIMFTLDHYFSLCWLLPSIVGALNIPTGQDSINQPSLPLLTNVTESNALLNASRLTEQVVECRSGLRSPQISSCLDALAQAPYDGAAVIGDPTYIYGPRGQGNFDVGLPSRWISCMFPALVYLNFILLLPPCILPHH